VRYRFADLVHLPEKLRAIDRLDDTVMLVDDMRVQERRGRWQRNLKAQVLRHGTLLAQCAKDAVGIDRGFWITQPADPDVIRAHARFQAHARRRRRAARHDGAALPGTRAFGGVRDAPACGEFFGVVLERWIFLEHEAQARDPRSPRPGLAVRDALHALAKQRAHAAKDFLAVLQAHAADEQHFAGW